ncbi:endo-1,4-beta-xylanase [Niabella sp. CJ426]|uniref:endo-1,4-beta-xylanase n=1 Tax=Niabella sp. CJ426 TaxID=3393740 RepID=UPI003CFEF999
MRKTITSYSGAALSAMMLFIVTGCAKFSDREFSVDKPESILNQEAINALPSLKSLINRTASPNFRLGTVVPANTYQTGGSAIFKIADRNFDEVVLETEMKHGSIVQTDGSLNISGVKQFVDFAAQKNVGVYGQVLTHHLNQNAAYLNGLLKGASGTTVINFESDALGKTYVMTGNSTSVVENDPKGGASKVLHIGNSTTPANQSFPKFPITLPAGIKLGNCSQVVLDILAPGSGGLFGSGMRLGVNDRALTVYGSPSSFGATDNSWFTGGRIILPFSNMNLTPAEKELTSFTLVLGSGTGSGNYYIDNVVISWNAEKTAAEKNTIVSAELNRFISGIVDSTKSVVKAWDVVKDPMDDSNPTQLKTGIGKSQGANEFYWQDYMGTSYAAKAFQYARQHVNSGDKLFISDNGLESNLAKCNGLISYIQNTESQGAIIDGISTQMHISISTDKSNIAQHLSLLAATQKLIRISELDVSLNGTTTSSATATQLQAQADMYKYVIEKYFELIPPAQRYGITFWSPQDRPSGATWLANQPVGIWNGQWVRKVGYKAVVEALEAKGK